METFRSRLPRIPVLTKCFCLPLHTGILIFGSFNLILSSVILPKMVRRVLYYPRGSSDPEGSTAGEAANLEALETLEWQRQAITVVWMAIDIALSVLLLAATHLNKPALLKTYLALGAVLQALSLATDVALYEFDDHYDNFVYFFFIGMNVYLLYMVYSYVYPRSGSTAGVSYKTQQDEQPII